MKENRVIIIGSTAIKHFYPDFNREPHDLDIVVQDPSSFEKEKGIEYLHNTILFEVEQGEFISMGNLLTLKMSHMFWDNNWEKHMYDIQFLLKKGHKYDSNLLSRFREYWEKTLPKVKRSRLELDKESFFNNAVNEDVNEHDYLHTLLAEVPAYTKLLKEGCEVELDESKWDNMSFKEKCDVVFEETAVMAYERYKNTSYIVAYKRQLKDNIIKHFPQYIALFAIENYIKLERPMFNYREVILNKLEYDKV